MYTLISGSPKVRLSSSVNFLQELSKKKDKYNLFELRKDKYDVIINSIEKSDVIVLSFQLYVDSPTSIVLSFMDYIIDNKIKLTNKLIYVIVNCGFRESVQNKTAVNILKNWCLKVDAKYMGSLQIGAGEIVGHNEYNFISRKVKKAVLKFSDIVRDKREIDDMHATVDFFTNKLFCFVANHFWNKRASKNNLLEKDVRIK